MRQVIDNIGSVFRVAVPMLLYFTIMWLGTFFGCWRLGVRYEDSVVQAFTASSNNFELAIAVAVGVFGVNSAVRLTPGHVSLESTVRRGSHPAMNLPLGSGSGMWALLEALLCMAWWLLPDCCPPA